MGHYLDIERSCLRPLHRSDQCLDRTIHRTLHKDGQGDADQYHGRSQGQQHLTAFLGLILLGGFP